MFIRKEMALENYTRRQEALEGSLRRTIEKQLNAYTKDEIMIFDVPVDLETARIQKAVDDLRDYGWTVVVSDKVLVVY